MTTELEISGFVIMFIADELWVSSIFVGRFSNCYFVGVQNGKRSDKYDVWMEEDMAAAYSLD